VRVCSNCSVNQHSFGLPASSCHLLSPSRGWGWARGGEGWGERIPPLPCMSLIAQLCLSLYGGSFYLLKTHFFSNMSSYICTYFPGLNMLLYFGSAGTLSCLVILECILLFVYSVLSHDVYVLSDHQLNVLLNLKCQPHIPLIKNLCTCLVFIKIKKKGFWLWVLNI